MLVEERLAALMALTAAELDDVLRARELERRAIEADLALAAAVVEARQQFLDDGHHSMNGYLQAQLNCSRGEALRIRRLAKLVDSHPRVGDALCAGRIGVVQADRLARANAHPRAGRRFGEFAPVLVEHGERLRFDDFALVVDRFTILADPDGAFDDQQFHEDHANATVAAGRDGVHISVTGGSVIQAAEMKAVFDRAVQAEFEEDCATRRELHGDGAASHALPRTAAQRRFAAQYAIHMAYGSMPPGAVAPKPVVNVVFSAAYAASTMAAHGLADTDVFGSSAPVPTTPGDWLQQRCETSTGIAIHPDDALRAMLSGHVRRVVVDSASVIIDRGRKQRLFTGEARDAAQLLAVRCAHPGCAIPAELCDVDHLTPWGELGRTDQANATPLCGGHNRFKHRKHWRTHRDTNGNLHHTRSDNTAVQPAGQPPPGSLETADPPDPRSRSA